MRIGPAKSDLNGENKVGDSDCPPCKLCFIAWTFTGRFYTHRCAFCRRIKEIWARMTPSERYNSYLPDSPTPVKTDVQKPTKTIIYRTRMNIDVAQHICPSVYAKDAVD